MNKKQLTKEYAEKLGVTKSEAESLLETMLDLIVSTVKKRDKVTLAGFGTFTVIKLKSTERRNPRTGERFTAPAKYVPKFRPGKQFKSLMPKI